MQIKEEKITYGSHPRQYAVVVSSPKTTTPGKVAFYFHGGAWTFGRPEAFLPAAIPWLGAGFTVIFPSYRRLPQVGLGGVLEDCWAVISHFCPPETVPHLHVGGISAGAHLAALLAAQPAQWLARGWSHPPRRILCCAGPLSFAELRTHRFFLPRYAALDAIQRLMPAKKAFAQEWLLIHGRADLMVKVTHSIKFHERLQELGHPAQLFLLDGGTHLDSG
ncbi:MAG: alpha/beta hydrolase, partial [Bacteroidota bacterium]